MCDSAPERRERADVREQKEIRAEGAERPKAEATEERQRDERSGQEHERAEKPPPHEHADTDETFIVLDGQLRIDLRDGFVLISAGEMFVVPKGTEHKPYAEREVKLLLIEPRGVKNTGEEVSERTAANDVWI